VVLHEYGHAVHFAQGFSFSTDEAGAISEGFGDYLAVTVSEAVRARLGRSASSDPACVADWDAFSYTSTEPHCLRRVDLDLNYPEDLRGEVHADGRIWSRALWDLRGALGARIADAVVLEGQFGFDGGTMPALGGHGRGRAAPLRQRHGQQGRGGLRGPGHPRLTRRRDRPAPPGRSRRRLERSRMEESGHARRCTNHARTHLGGG
jgi:hypothetical protein